MAAQKRLSSRTALTARQREVLDYVCSYREQHGFSPSLVEIAAKLKIRSLTSVLGHLRALEKKGFIRRSAGVSRSIIPTKACRKTPKIPARAFAGIRDGKIVANSGTETEDLGYFNKIRDTLGGDCFFLRVLDDRFARYSIFAGDCLLVQRTRTAFLHEIAILQDVDDEFLLGECVYDTRKHETYIKMADIYERKWMKNRSICGVLVSVIRDFSRYFS